MEELQKAIIKADGEVKCPICGEVNGHVTGSNFSGAFQNYKIRCKNSASGNEHFFLLFAGNEENAKLIGKENK